MFENVDGRRTDARVTGILIAHLGAFSSGELKTNSHMSICDVIVMLKCCHHVTSQRIQDFLEAFFMFFQYKMWYLVVSNKTDPLFV